MNYKYFFLLIVILEIMSISLTLLCSLQISTFLDTREIFEDEVTTTYPNARAEPFVGFAFMTAILGFLIAITNINLIALHIWLR